MDHVQLWTQEITLVESVAITADSDTIDIGELVQLSAWVVPDSATEIGVSWSLSSTEDSTFAHIDSRGYVRGLAEGSFTAHATAKDGSGVVGTYDMHVRMPVGIRQSEAIQISLFPNPTHGILNIVTDQDHCTYTIWSVHDGYVRRGQKHLNGTIEASSDYAFNLIAFDALKAELLENIGSFEDQGVYFP